MLNLLDRTCIAIRTCNYNSKSADITSSSTNIHITSNLTKILKLQSVRKIRTNDQKRVDIKMQSHLGLIRDALSWRLMNNCQSSVAPMPVPDPHATHACYIERDATRSIAIGKQDGFIVIQAVWDYRRRSPVLHLLGLLILYHLIYTTKFDASDYVSAALSLSQMRLSSKIAMTSILLVTSIKQHAQVNTRLLHANWLTRNSHLDMENHHLKKCYAAIES